MALDPRTPCLVGVAQETVRPPGPAPEPLESWERVARAAAADAGAPGLLEQLDSVQVVYCQSWPYDDPVGRLADRLGADPKHRLYSGIGGTTPQVLLSDTVAAVARGEMERALVVGAEALATLRALKKVGERAAWSHRDPERKPFPFEAMPHPSEVAHQVFQAYLTFALFDVARSAARGWSPVEERADRGAFMAPMTEVAAKNPYAWFPVARSAEELVTPVPENRIVAWPYSKYTVSVMDVDMAAAVLVTSTAAADAAGVPQDQRVYLHSWGYGEDSWVVAERADFTTSPAMRAVSAAVLQAAGVGPDDVSRFDLYSCFASSVRFACDALGLDPLDPRGVTVTGGLPFAGGPASNYMLHAVATMADELRRQPGSQGLVSGVGMHMTKHTYALWSTTPAAPRPADPTALDRELAEVPRRQVVGGYAGPAQVVTGSVVHGRDGAPEWGLLVVDTPAGDRAYARVEPPELLAQLEAEGVVGRAVSLASDGQVNTATW